MVALSSRMVLVKLAVTGPFPTFVNKGTEPRKFPFEIEVVQRRRQVGVIGVG